VQSSTFVLRLNFCAVNPRLRQYPNRYTNLIEFISNYEGPVYGAFMDGEDVHRVKFSKGGLLVIGNEANGISTAVEKLISQKITITRIGGAESLNAAIATGIMLDVITQSKK
jgi:RNA methyltransferase, TrmH family